MRLLLRGKFLCLLTGIVLAGLAPAADLAPSMELVQTIVSKGKAGKLDHLALDAKRDRLFLANTSNGSLDVFDLKAGKLLRQVTGQTGIAGVSYAPDLDRVFVGLGTGQVCNVFAGENYAIQKTVKFPGDCDNVRYDAASNQVFVAHDEKMLGVIDAKTYAMKGEIKLPGAAEGFQVVSGQPKLFLVVPSPSQLVTIDTNERKVTGNYPIKAAANGHPLAIDEANKRVFVGCRQEPMVVVLDAETGREVTSIPVPKDIDDLYLDAPRKRLYASCGEGFVTVIRQMDADRYEVAEKVPTASGAKTSYYDAAGSRLFVAVPRQPGKEGPEIRVFKVKD
jgi:DNA-binding beta-propeller fold protein YncE